MVEEQMSNSTPISDMLVFLVKGSISISEYMGSARIIEKTHIVYALDEKDAKRKFTEHYNKKTSEYSVYYDVNWVDVEETLF